MCKLCEKKPVFKLLNGEGLCKNCFIKYFEKKVFKTITKFKLVKNNEKILVAVSGGKDSLSALYLINKLNDKKMNIKVEAILIDEGIKNYRKESIDDAKRFCKKINVKLHIYNFKDEFKKTSDDLAKQFGTPCNACGIFRRYLLNKKSRELKADKLVTGHNLDDEAQSILMNQFRNQVEISARLGPITGVIRDKKFVLRIKPLYLMSEKEVSVYAFLKGIKGNFVKCPYSGTSYRGHVRKFLNDFEEKHPGTKYGIVNSFLEILPLIKEKYRTDKKVSYCKECGEACSGSICKTCQLIKKIK